MKHSSNVIFLSAVLCGLASTDSVELKPNKPCRFELVLLLVVTAFLLGAGQCPTQILICAMFRAAHSCKDFYFAIKKNFNTTR